MGTCWYTSDSCLPETCNGHGKCSDTLGNVKCDCDWGYEGDSCEVNKDRVTNTTDSFFTRLGNYIIDFPTIYAVQTNSWIFLTIAAKSIGKIYRSTGEDVGCRRIETSELYYSGPARNSSSSQSILHDAGNYLCFVFQ